MRDSYKNIINYRIIILNNNRFRANDIVLLRKASISVSPFGSIRYNLFLDGVIMNIQQVCHFISNSSVLAQRAAWKNYLTQLWNLPDDQLDGKILGAFKGMDVDQVADQLARNTLFPAFDIDPRNGNLYLIGIDPRDEQKISIQEQGLTRVYPYSSDEYYNLIENKKEFGRVSEYMTRKGLQLSFFEKLRIARYVLTSIISNF